MAEDIESLAQTLQPDEVQLFYSVAVNSRHELSLAPDEYAGFVMTCLRMLALLPADRIVPPMSPAPETAARPSNDPATPELTPPAPIASTPAVESPMPEPAVAAPVAV